MISPTNGGDIRLFIMDLPSQTREEHVHQLFRSHNFDVLKLNLLGGKNFVQPGTTTMLNYGFVVLTSNEEALRAVAELDKIFFMGRAIRVKYVSASGYVEHHVAESQQQSQLMPQPQMSRLALTNKSQPVQPDQTDSSIFSQRALIQTQTQPNQQIQSVAPTKQSTHFVDSSLDQECDGDASESSDGPSPNYIIVKFRALEVSTKVTVANIARVFSTFGEVTDVSVKSSNKQRGTNELHHGNATVHYLPDKDGLDACFDAIDGIVESPIIDGVEYICEASRELFRKLREIHRKSTSTGNSKPNPQISGSTKDDAQYELHHGINSAVSGTAKLHTSPIEAIATSFSSMSVSSYSGIRDFEGSLDQSTKFSVRPKSQFPESGQFHRDREVYSCSQQMEQKVITKQSPQQTVLKPGDSQFSQQLKSGDNKNSNQFQTHGQPMSKPLINVQSNITSHKSMPHPQHLQQLHQDSSGGYIVPVMYPMPFPPNQLSFYQSPLSENPPSFPSPNSYIPNSVQQNQYADIAYSNNHTQFQYLGQLSQHQSNTFQSKRSGGGNFQMSGNNKGNVYSNSNFKGLNNSSEFDRSKYSDSISHSGSHISSQPKEQGLGSGKEFSATNYEGSSGCSSSTSNVKVGHWMSDDSWRHDRRFNESNHEVSGQNKFVQTAQPAASSAYPVAAHSPPLPEARLGHDNTSANSQYLEYPGYRTDTDANEAFPYAFAESIAFVRPTQNTTSFHVVAGPSASGKSSLVNSSMPPYGWTASVESEESVPTNNFYKYNTTGAFTTAATDRDEFFLYSINGSGTCGLVDSATASGFKSGIGVSGATDVSSTMDSSGSTTVASTELLSRVPSTASGLGVMSPSRKSITSYRLNGPLNSPGSSREFDMNEPYLSIGSVGVVATDGASGTTVSKEEGSKSKENERYRRFKHRKHMERLMKKFLPSSFLDNDNKDDDV